MTVSYSAKWGGFAEFGTAKDFRSMKEDGLRPVQWQSFTAHQVVPGTIDPKAGIMMTQWRETLSYFTRLGIRPGASLLIIGSGANGLAFAAHAKNYGVSEIVMSGNCKRRSVAIAVGATDFFDYQSPRLGRDIGLKYEKGFDVIIDAVGKRESLNTHLNLLKFSGTVGIFGIDDYGSCSINPHKVRGNFMVYNGGYNEGEAHAAVVEMIGNGSLDARIWLDPDEIFGFNDITEAYSRVKERKAVKVLLRP